MSDKSSRPYPPYGLIQIKPHQPKPHRVESPFNNSSAEKITVNCQKIGENKLDFYGMNLKYFTITFQTLEKPKIDQPFRLGDFGTQPSGNTDQFESVPFMIGNKHAQRLQVLANQGRLGDKAPCITYQIDSVSDAGVQFESIDPDAYLEC